MTTWAEHAEHQEFERSWWGDCTNTFEALVGLTRFLTSSWEEAGQSPAVLALLAFTVGWDAHRLLRGEAS